MSFPSSSAASSLTTTTSSSSSSSSSSSQSSNNNASNSKRVTLSTSASAFASAHQELLYVDLQTQDVDDDHEDGDRADDGRRRTTNGTTFPSSTFQNRSPFQDEIDNLTKSCFTKLLPTAAASSSSTKHDDYTNTRSSTNDNNNMQQMNGYDHHRDSAMVKDDFGTTDHLNALDDELGNGSIWDDDQYNDDVDHDEMTSQTSRNHAGKNPQFPYKTPLEMLRNFDHENQPSADNPLELQLWMECFAQREAVLKHQQLVDKARDRKAFEAMSLMKQHVIKWFEDLRTAIDGRQKEYFLRNDKRTGHKRYGPFLCSLHPDKMAVITSQEAITQCLTHAGKSGGLVGVPLVRLAHMIGTAVETEVVSQRRMKEKFHSSVMSVSHSDATSSTSLVDADHDDNNVYLAEENDDSNRYAKADKSYVENTAMKPEQAKVDLSDKWQFSSSHLKMFLDDIDRNGKGRNRRAIRYATKKAKEAMNSNEAWTIDDIVHVGAALLSILVDHAKVVENGKEQPAFRVEKKWFHVDETDKKFKSQSFIIMHDRLRKAFLEDEYLSWAANTTRYTPMLVEPTDWSSSHIGGYKWLKSDLMRCHGSTVQREALEVADLSVVCDGLNILGKTPWKINKEILRIGQHCWDNNIPIGDIPSRTDLEVPAEKERPAYVDLDVHLDRDSPEAQERWKKYREYNESAFKRRRILQKNMDLRSLRCSATLKLDQAKQFQDFERIYFPYNLDFRGRAYPIPPHLSNVGSDLCRGMLKFADSKPLGKRGLYWLKVHLANFAGMDKVSFDERAKFIEENMENVRQSVDNPFSDDPWWMTLDDPFQGLATCHEIINAIDSGDPESYMCSLPVHMDGSCNGLQHYAALGRDTAGGKAVNLLKGDEPEDVYLGVMHEVIRRVAEEAASEVPFDTSDPNSLTRQQQVALNHNKAAKLVNGLIDRGVVKRTVMTSVYGVTYIGARQQIQEKIEEKLEEKGYDLDEIDRDLFQASGYLATITMEVMGELFQGAKKTKTWLADCARIISRHGHPVAWVSPIGVPAIQPYRQRRPRTIVTVMQTVTVIDDNDDLQVHKARQCTAFPPNYVHSLDSSHMLMTAMEMDRRGLTFSAVHDSFWTHACDVDEMNEALRDCFIDLYSRPLLQDLKESWELRYPGVQFPDLPELGGLDLNEVKSATYFFQ